MALAMTLLKAFGSVVLIAAVTGIAMGLRGSTRDGRSTQAVWDALLTQRDPMPESFDPIMVADLPEIAQRYFASAISPGTPLHGVARLEMEGSLILNGRKMPMHGDQIIAPPRGFVWRARAGSGWIRFTGSDGYRAGQTSWTRFWLWGVLPVARVVDTEDHARAAAARMVMETVWSPATLLPQFGVVWRQTAQDQAEVRFAKVPEVEPIHLTLDASGQVLEITTQRWSDANPDRTYRLQPFGGRMLAHATHQGFTIPTMMEIGNLYGTPDYAPFFRARLTSVKF
ncbi:DUF6544 family protein [Ectothiorhodospira marina]|jgi:hypothetical protein|uniref:Uncharacterized protein n=1 Tax=Ectothiorhodospira marina TaxID=1396821 RepID=A0A1H7PSP0_9GAMM|nr:DUF6544 family protein [Ectothiorhodospira marina]SEL38629.1 hypothetical protein SAMN05444515_1155 [Ectothiorhodospira marina]